MRARSSLGTLLTAALLAVGCATVPTGPSVMALPGRRKSFDEFRFDDHVCRDFALHAAGVAPEAAASDSGVAAAAIGTGVGAAAGAAIGAATGDAAKGAAIGAGSGLLLGSAVGIDQAGYAGASAQDRYDTGYVQCMYAKGNQVPIAGGPGAPYMTQLPAARPLQRPHDIPPPPPGPPPPPPPGAG